MKPVLDWSAYKDAGMGDAYADIPKSGGDFAKAVAVCINSRRCEAATRGVMCPSYRVSGDPALSPGGRVRLLRTALNSEPGDASFQETELARAMDLCVGCKGCKRECENEVDMAMIKVEYLAQRHGRERVPFRTLAFAHLSRNLRRYAWLKRLPAIRNRVPLLASLAESLLGISAKRRLPEPAPSTFSQRRGRRASGGSSLPKSSAAEVVLLVDTFTDNFAPQQAEDAIAVLSKAGYRVTVAHPGPDTPDPDRPLCCGRTHLAHGLVEQARIDARRMLTVLLPHAEAGRQIIGLEPACLLAIRDDYRFLGLGRDAETVASHAILFEEFIARELAAKRFHLELKSLDTHGEPLLVHGHCHQKAVGAMKSMRKALKLIPDLEFELIDSSCCGMAGSFGIEKEHAEIAMDMAEQSLLPALRQHEGARVLANGFSCRHQIREGVGRASLHLASLLREAMA